MDASDPFPPVVDPDVGPEVAVGPVLHRYAVPALGAAGHRGDAHEENLTIRTGNCPHRRYIPDLVRLTATGAVDPATVLTQVDTVPEAVEAYRSFDRREDGWIKTALVTEAGGT